MVKYGDPLQALAGGHTTVEIHKLFFINYSVLTEKMTNCLSSQRVNSDISLCLKLMLYVRTTLTDSYSCTETSSFFFL